MAFVVLDYHFNLRKIFRDLERNGIQNAICPPGVKYGYCDPDNPVTSILSVVS